MRGKVGSSELLSLLLTWVWTAQVAKKRREIGPLSVSPNCSSKDANCPRCPSRKKICKKCHYTMGGRPKRYGRTPQKNKNPCPRAPLFAPPHNWRRYTVPPPLYGRYFRYPTVVATGFFSIHLRGDFDGSNGCTPPSSGNQSVNQSLLSFFAPSLAASITFTFNWWRCYSNVFRKLELGCIG